MLKVSTLFLAAAAALGMSAVGAQTSPGSTGSGWSYYTHPDGTTRVYAGGTPVGGFQATQSGNTTKFTFSSAPTSPAPVTPGSPSAGNYTTLKRLGDGFTLEQKADIPVPGRNMSHPVALRKPVPPAAMAKALAKTFLPGAANLFALAELLELLFPDSTPSYDAAAGQWNLTTPGFIWRNNSGNVTASSPSGVCQQVTPNGWFYTLDSLTATAGRCVLWYGSPDNHGGYEYVQRVAAPATTSPVTPQSIEAAYPPAATNPAVQDAAEELLPYIPEQARKDLAQDSAGPGISVIPYTPDGQPSFEPWTGPETSKIETTTHDNGRSVTTISRTKTTGTPVQDGIRYDTTTTTTTTSQTTDPATGAPQTDPVTGEPVTETTTTTTTTEQGTNKPADGEDLECGLPGTPPCKIDETGTPQEAPPGIGEAADEYKTKMDEIREVVKGDADKGFLEPWRDVFLVPPIAACQPFVLPRDMGTIDPCPVVDGVREVMAYIWALTALWLCLGMVREVI